jgi:hypothetical protein
VEANLWFDEHESHQATVKDKIAIQIKVNNYSGLPVVNVQENMI